MLPINVNQQNAAADANRRSQTLQVCLLVVLFMLLSGPKNSANIGIANSNTHTVSERKGGTSDITSDAYLSNFKHTFTFIDLQHPYTDNNPINVTGNYRGNWSEIVRPIITSAISATSTGNDTWNTTMYRSKGLYIMQLKTVPIVADVKNIEFVYGVIKVYDGGSSTGNKYNHDIMIPVQGVYLPNLGITTMFATPLTTHSLYMQLPISNTSSSSGVSRALAAADTSTNGNRKFLSVAADSYINDTGIRMFLLDSSVDATKLRQTGVNATTDAVNVSNTDTISRIGQSLVSDSFRALQVKSRSDVTKYCQYIITLKHRSRTDSEGVTTSIDTQGLLTSPQCNVNVDMFASSYIIPLKRLTHKTMIYSIITTIVCIAQIMLSIYQLKYSNSPAVISKISIVCICMHSLLDATLCVGHLLLAAALPKELFTYFVWTISLKLFLFGLFEVRLIIGVYRARFSTEIAAGGWNYLRMTLTAFHIRFYLAFFSIVIFIAVFHDMLILLVLLLYSSFIPQIVYSAYHGTRKALSPVYYVGMTISRMFIPLYFLSCPSNFLYVLIGNNDSSSTGAAAEQYMSVSLFFICWLWLQVLILYLQDKYGSRFFIPNSLYPSKYNYYRPVHQTVTESRTGISTDVESGNTNECECVICYNSIDISSYTSTGRYMITPCEHLFHKECLSQWLLVKLECPVCRATLPCNDEDD